MRPLTITMEGFGSFRKRTEIDFANADLFVLSGPTGSGKSTILDAMAFALYGQVPRHDSKSSAPVIAAGARKALVSLTFSLNGTEYVAARELVRTKTGANTREARLERDGHAIASGSADDVTKAVRDLLGLEFVEFSKVVMLPQGAFSEFLKAKPKARQDLLVNLLGVGAYRSYAKLARDKASEYEMAAEVATGGLDQYAHATPEAIADAEARLSLLTAARDKVVDAQPNLDTIRERGASLRVEAEAAHAAVTTAEALTLPVGLDGLTERLTAARDQLAAAKASLDDAIETRQSAEDAVSGVDVAALRNALSQHAELATLRTNHAALEATLAAAAEALADTESARGQAVAAVERAEDLVARRQRDHAASGIAADLTHGDDCPVCGHTFDESAPEHDASALAEAQATLTQAREVLADADTQVAAARQDHTHAEATLAAAVTAGNATKDALSRTCERLPASVLTADGALNVDQANAAIDAWEQADSQRQAATAAERAARADVTDAESALTALDDEKQQAWTSFDSARDALSSLGAPGRASDDDPATSWAALLTWRDAALPDLREKHTQAQAAIAAAVTEWKTTANEIADVVRNVGVDVTDDGQARDVIVAEVSRQEQTLTRLQDDIVRARELAEKSTQAREQHQVAHEVAQLLRVNNFERWMLGRAMERLVLSATDTLLELSDGAYSVALDDNQEFEVVDHTNADERRSVKTLSGGETFLVSLSLALALAEHVTEVAASGARIESLFLDEGFGTLDGDTLDMVASTLEELHSRGKMVGVITHVKELAERIPARFDVKKTPHGSVVERR